MRGILSIPGVFLELVLRSVQLALAQLWRHKLRSALTTLAIVIGVASVCTVSAALFGLWEIIFQDFEKLGTTRMFIQAYRPWTGPQRHLPWAALQLRLDDLEGLTECCPSVSYFTRVTSGGSRVSAPPEHAEEPRVFGVDPHWHMIEKRAVTLGRPFCYIDGLERRRVCLLSPETRDELKFDRDCVGETIIVDDRSYRVVGVVEPGPEYELINAGQAGLREVLVPFETAYIDGRTGLWAEALAESPSAVEEAAGEITFFMRRTRDISPGLPDNFHIETTKSYLDQFTTVSQATNLAAVAVVSLSLLVGGISVMNIMLVSVNERTREIGLRKAVGAHPATICLQFLIEAVVLCLFGGAMGVAAGYGLAFALRSVPGIDLSRAMVPAGTVAASFGFTAFVGLFFGVFPAIKAARLDPIVALRHE